MSNGRRAWLARSWPVVLVVLVGVASSFAVTAGVQANQHDARTSRFRSDSERARVLIQARVDERTGIHEMLRDAVVSQWPIDRADFRELVATDDAGRDLFEGVRAVSFNRRVSAEIREVYEAGVRADGTLDPGGYPDFSVRPDPDGRRELVVVEYLEPLAGNEAALGFDLFSDPARRRSVEEARDSGALIASAPVDLVQASGSERGLLLVSAVYDVPGPLVSAPSRRRHFVGAVVTVVETRALLEEALGAEPRVELEIYDQGDTAESRDTGFGDDALVYAAEGARFADPAGEVDQETIRLDLNVGGRRWALVTRPGGDDAGGTVAPVFVLVLGLALTAALGVAGASTTGARRRAEQLAQRRTADLYSIIESAPDPTVVVDADGTVVLASDRIEDLLGYTPEEVRGIAVEDLVPDELRTKHRVHRTDYALAPSARMLQVEGADGGLRARRKDGSTVPVEISLSPLPEHSLGSVVASLRDVTVQRAAVEELERASQMKSRFLETISHELNTPMTAISGFARLLQTSPSLDDVTAQQFIGRIVANVDGLNALIGEVLDFSRLERSTVSLEPETGELLAMAHSLVSQLGDVVASHPVEVVGSPTPVYVDAHALARILTNLLTNAVRYTPEGTPVRITVQPDANGDAVLVVDDSGPGIPEDEFPRLFDRFWRGQAAVDTRAQGSGIGLAVVAELCLLSGGTIEPGRSPGGGARFTVTLPGRRPT